jgi:hypothetical protein
MACPPPCGAVVVGAYPLPARSASVAGGASLNVAATAATCPAAPSVARSVTVPLPTERSRGRPSIGHTCSMPTTHAGTTAPVLRGQARNTAAQPMDTCRHGCANPPDTRRCTAPMAQELAQDVERRSIGLATSQRHHAEPRQQRTDDRPARQLQITQDVHRTANCDRERQRVSMRHMRGRDQDRARFRHVRIALDADSQPSAQQWAQDQSDCRTLARHHRCQGPRNTRCRNRRRHRHSRFRVRLMPP